jgi:hypothetical protein
MSAPPETNPPRDDDDADLLRWLTNRNAACPICGYNLRALTIPRCPECGERLQLGVRAVDPRLAPWIVLLVFVCAAGGVGLMFLIAVMLTGFPPAGRIPICLIIAMAPTAIVVACTRRHFQRKLAPAMQWLVALAVALALIIVFIILFKTMP